MANAAYQVVARRYRPQLFADLIGQEHVARGLSGAIESGRIGHAYLFTGARGVGKTSAARITSWFRIEPAATNNPRRWSTVSAVMPSAQPSCQQSASTTCSGEREHGAWRAKQSERVLVWKRGARKQDDPPGRCLHRSSSE